MQAKKPYISTGLRHIFAIVSSQISTMMEPVNAILKHEPANRRLEISPLDISFLTSLSIIHNNDEEQLLQNRLHESEYRRLVC